MGWSLEVVSAPSSSLLVPGQVAPLPTRIGRRPENELLVYFETVPGRACRIEASETGMRLVDLGGTWGSFVNGKRAQLQPLSPGDLVELPVCLVFKVLGPKGAPPPAFVNFPGPLAQAVAEAPSDAGRWRVWADKLLEEGNPLAEGIIREQTRPLPPTLKASWHHGFIRRAALRESVDYHGISWLSTWKALLEDPLAYFLEEVEIDARSYIPRSSSDALHRALHAAIAATLVMLAARPAPLPSLRALRFDPMPRGDWESQLVEPWAAARARHPALVEGPVG